MKPIFSIGSIYVYRHEGILFFVSRGSNGYYRVMYVKPSVKVTFPEEVAEGLRMIDEDRGFSSEVKAFEVDAATIEGELQQAFLNIKPEMTTPTMWERESSK